MPKDEQELIEAFREGDELAFVSLYNRYKDAVYGFCLKMMQDRERAEDLMQDTFMRVYENRDRLHHTKAFKSWLFTIARNQCLNTLRRDKRREPMEEHQRRSVQAPHTPASQMEKSEQIELVNEYLQHLKPSYRELLSCASMKDYRTRRLPR